MLTLEDSTIKNSYFKRGIIYIYDSKNISGKTIFKRSKFLNNTSEKGTILHIADLNYDTGSKFEFYNNTFTNNIASKFGGVFYVMNKHEFNLPRFKIEGNTFKNNHAQIGDILYSYLNNTFPEFDNIAETSRASLPSYFKMYENKTEKITLLSGEHIPSGISCK